MTAGFFDPAGAADAAVAAAAAQVAAHVIDATDVHGIVDTSQLLLRTDPRLIATLRPAPTVMATPPTFTLSANGAGAQLAGGVPIRADDARFDYSGLAMLDASSNTGVAGSLGSTATTDQWTYTSGEQPIGFRVGFDTDADKVEVRFKAYPNGNVYPSPFLYRVWVDGQPHVTYMANDQTPVNGGMYYELIDFGSARPRQVIIEMTGADIISIACVPTRSIWPSSRIKGPNVVFIGDSFVSGLGTIKNGSFDSFAPVAGHALGWNVFTNGVGSSGYYYPQGGVPGVDTVINYMDRFTHDVTALDALVGLDRVVWCCGINDASTNVTLPQVTAAAAALFAKCATEIPDADQVVVLPFAVANSDATFHNPNLFGKCKTMRDGIKASAIAAGLPWIDPIGSVSGKEWITGTGYATHLIGDGNADTYIQADGIHPGTDGHLFLGRRVAAGMAALGLTA